MATVGKKFRRSCHGATRRFRKKLMFYVSKTSLFVMAAQKQTRQRNSKTKRFLCFPRANDALLTFTHSVLSFQTSKPKSRKLASQVPTPVPDESGKPNPNNYLVLMTSLPSLPAWNYNQLLSEFAQIIFLNFSLLF